MNNPVNLVDPSGLCGLRDPWNCVDEPFEWYWGEITAVDSVTDAIVVADVLPLAEFCAIVGAVGGAASGASTGGVGIAPGLLVGGGAGYGVCSQVEGVLGTPAFVVTQWQIFTSGCDLTTMGTTTYINAVNWRLDLGPALGEPLEVAAYEAVGRLILQCSVAPPSTTLPSKRW